jgi:NTE family protein
VIDGVPYVDGGAASIASVDVLRHTTVDEVYVLAPMASVELDHPAGTAARFERRLRRVVTRRILADIEMLRASGMRVVLVTPGPDDLSAMGANMMNPTRRTEVFDTARETAATSLRTDLAGERRATSRRRQERG